MRVPVSVSGVHCGRGRPGGYALGTDTRPADYGTPTSSGSASAFAWMRNCSPKAPARFRVRCNARAAVSPTTSGALRSPGAQSGPAGASVFPRLFYEALEVVAADQKLL